VLVNAIYFKGDWALPFDEKQTKQEQFYPGQAEPVLVPMMTVKDDFRYGDTPLLQVLELPYAGRDLSMLVLLPKERTGLGDLEQSLNLENLKQWTRALRSREVQVFLPKFKLESEFDLKSTLQRLGIRDAFDARRADLSGMDGRPHWLSIGTAVHKAYIEVNEEGTEAAAATAIGIRATSIAPVRPQPVVFRADHPFVYVIRDNRTQSILFMGKVTNPN
jgi:serpin B